MADHDLFSDHSANQANLGFEEALWAAADKFRGHLEVSQYKHIVLGMLFLRLAEHIAREKVRSTAEFTLPTIASWDQIAKAPASGLVGKLNGAISSLRRANPALRELFPEKFIATTLPIDVLSDVVTALNRPIVDLKQKHSVDILGRVYEYFLGAFARAEGNKGGEFYTPQCVVDLLVQMLAPFKGTVYDPCCGSGGMFVQSREFIRSHGGRESDISLYGQESNLTTWRLAQMNLLLHGLRANLGTAHADTFRNDIHSSLEADYILANPPFNQKDWGASTLANDVRWRFGIPPATSANYAWIQHIINHLGPSGRAGFVLANGALSSNSAGEDKIRVGIVEADFVDCVVGMPSQLFYSTAIPCSLWFLERRATGAARAIGKRMPRIGETLFIDTRSFGVMTDRTHRELTHSEIAKITSTYHSWRGEGSTSYKDVAGFCRSVNKEEIRAHRYALVPGRYVGFADRQSLAPALDKLRSELSVLESYLNTASATSAQALAVIRGLVRG